MKIDHFEVTSDLVGRRVRIYWQLSPTAPGEQAIPQVTVHRKTLDFEFPAAPADMAPFLVYSTAAFPPAGYQVSELPPRQTRPSAATLEFEEVSSVWREVRGVRVEALRLTTRTTRSLEGIVLARTIELLDSGTGEGLTPGTTYYYRMETVPASTRYQGVATPGDNHGFGRTMFESMPNAVTRHDVARGVPTPGAEAIPEANPNNGQLRRFLDMFGVALDSMRSGAEGLARLNDIDNVDYRFLPYHASTVGWELSFQASVPVQRHEIKYAAALYRITGTIPGTMIWTKRLTGWNSRIKEFARNVFFTYNSGYPRLEGDRSARTVNTADAALLANMGRFEDTVHYTYDTGTGPNDWYALNVVGIFVDPPDSEGIEAVRTKAARLRLNLSLFLPFNIRGVVIVVTGEGRGSASGTLDLLQGTSDT